MLTTPLAACWCFEVAGRQCGHGFYPCAHPSTSIPASLPSSCWPSPWLLPDTSVPYLALIMLIFAVGGDGKWGNWRLGAVGRGRCVVVVLPVTSELQPGGLCCSVILLSSILYSCTLYLHAYLMMHMESVKTKQELPNHCACRSMRLAGAMNRELNLNLYPCGSCSFP